jgi:cell division protein FtsI (penicillin-binding protein 3)
VAQATVPSFDANSPGSADAALRGNRALSDVYEPGSTSKMMTMAAVLDSGKASALSQFSVPYSIRFGTRTLHDHDRHGLERMTLNGILAQSSNMGTYLAARLIGPRALYAKLKQFGIGEHTGLTFPGESRGFVLDPSQWSVTSFPTIAYGQGLSLNAIQAASAYATIANDGVRMTPRLIAGTVSANGAFTAAKPSTGVRVVSRKTARTLRQMLETVVQSGTGGSAAVTGYRVAGKTGTASRFDAKLNRYQGYVASFIGMLPADKPDLVIAVSIHNPRGAHFGGVIAAPVFSKVATFAVQDQRIPPSASAAARLPQKW